MRFKYYLRGTGIGIIVAMVLTMIVVAGKGGLMSDDKAIARAKELGYVLQEDTSGDATGQITNEDLANASQNDADTTTDETSDGTTDTTTDGTSDSTTDSVTDSTSNSDSNSTTDSSTDSTTDSQSSTDSSEISMTEPVSILISGSQSSESVASKLESAGLVDDASDFNNYLVKNGYDTRLQDGTFQIVPGATYEDIAKALTGK